MKILMISCAFLAFSSSVYCAPTKTISNTSESFKVFAQQYEKTFGEKPNKKVWNGWQKQDAAMCYCWMEAK